MKSEEGNSVWFRVFGTNDVQPEPAKLLEHIRERGYEVLGKFSADDEGWFRAELEITGTAVPLIIERYLAKESGIRGELNTWAAWVESAEHNPNQNGLMQHLISTTQLFTLHGPVHLCLELCKFLARVTGGIYQVDEHGLYSPDGTLLLEEA
jgi:hypothetical protein